MLAPKDLDRLLDECAAIDLRLGSGERRRLRHFLRLRERYGDGTAHHLSADDVELLEDWAAAEGRPAPAADIKRPGSRADRRQACRPERAKRAKRKKKQVSTVNNNA